MLSQKIKEKLETEGICRCVIISIRDDIEEQEQQWAEALRDVKRLRKAINTKNIIIENSLRSIEILKSQIEGKS